MHLFTIKIHPITGVFDTLNMKYVTFTTFLGFYYFLDMLVKHANRGVSFHVIKVYNVFLATTHFGLFIGVHENIETVSS